MVQPRSQADAPLAYSIISWIDRSVTNRFWSVDPCPFLSIFELNVRRTFLRKSHIAVKESLSFNMQPLSYYFQLLRTVMGFY